MPEAPKVTKERSGKVTIAAGGKTITLNENEAQQIQQAIKQLGRNAGAMRRDGEAVPDGGGGAARMEAGRDADPGGAGAGPGGGGAPGPDGGGGGGAARDPRAAAAGRGAGPGAFGPAGANAAGGGGAAGGPMGAAGQQEQGGGDAAGIGFLAEAKAYLMQIAVNCLTTRSISPFVRIALHLTNAALASAAIAAAENGNAIVTAVSKGFGLVAMALREVLARANASKGVAENGVKNQDQLAKQVVDGMGQGKDLARPA